jgi:hypothetical protein
VSAQRSVAKNERKWTKKLEGMRILIGQLDVKERVHALSSTQLKKIEKTLRLKSCFYAGLIKAVDMNHDWSPRCYSVNVVYIESIAYEKCNHHITSILSRVAAGVGRRVV